MTGHARNARPADSGHAIIVTRALRKTFWLGDQPVHALKRIDLTIRRGEFVAIMGPSGSGKSTLLYLLGGLDRPTGGGLRVAGRLLADLSGDELARFRRETIGFVFQAFHLVPSMTALENVALPGVFAGLPRDQREERAWRLLRWMGLENRLEHRPNQLSGGQQQRVAIARALFNNPPIIMADEPTGALDSRTGEAVMKLLRRMCERDGRTVLVVTHNPAVAAYADRVLHLRDGYLIRDGDRMEDEGDDRA
ncbi:MAG: ABC transporter ATP-binding protein [Anaerolineae bacterium]